MSRIDDLIAELAPNGIEFKALGEVCTVFNGYAFKSAMFNSDGDGLPIIRIRDVNTGFSDTFYSGDFDDRWLVEDGDILIGMDGDFRANRWKHGRALLNQRVCRLQGFSGDVIPDFIFYQIQDELDRIHSSITGSTVKHLSSRELERSRIPIPPLEVQREIVRILDQFTQLGAELEAELEARRRQYAYYRDVLLKSSDDEGARVVALADVIRLKFGSRITKKDNAGTLYPVYGGGGESFRTDAFNREDEWVISRFAMSANCVRRVAGKFWMLDSGFTFEVIDPSVDKDFVGQLLLNMQPTIFATSTQSAQKNIDVAGFKRLRVRVPSLQTQRRVASGLASFDKIVNDLSIGLPAELAARRKQYGHYRDRLLTFEEASA
ncbi:restriction endonuclease subunit S [Microbacterium profundi]